MMILKTKLDIALFQRAGSYFTSGGCEWVAYTACQFACWLFLLYLANVSHNLSQCQTIGRHK